MKKENTRAPAARESGFTPGPWEAVLRDDPRGQPCGTYRGLVAFVEQGNRSLAVVLGDRNLREMVPEWEWEANTRLIAAAPDLYRVAQGVIAVCEKPGLYAETVLLEQARAALAKADGIEPGNASESEPSLSTSSRATGKAEEAGQEPRAREER